jgi:hypothetical protein
MQHITDLPDVTKVEVRRGKNPTILEDRDTRPPSHMFQARGALKTADV